MSFGGITSIALAIVGVAFLFVAVSSKNTAPIITAFGTSFKGALGTAMGR